MNDQNKTIAPHLWLYAPPALAALLALAAFFWLSRSHAPLLPQRLPGADSNASAKAETKFSDTASQCKHIAGSGKPSADQSAPWPCFRGVKRDNVAHAEIPLARHWPQNGPSKLWSVPLGEGYAAAAVKNGIVYVLDYDEDNKRDTLRALSLDNGQEIWNQSYPVKIKRNHGMSRTIPAVTDKYVVTLGPRCHVLCADAISGDKRWFIDLQTEYGTKEPLWYAGQCPLIDGENVILAPAGNDVLLMAIDCATGKAVWKTPNPDGLQMSHASVIPATFYEIDGYLYPALGGTVFVRKDNGNLIWTTKEFRAKTIAPSPVILDNNRFVLCAGYGYGGMLFQANATDEPTVIRTTNPRQFSCEQQTPVYCDGLLYSVLPKPRQELTCFDPELNELWTSGPVRTFGLGPYLIAGDLIYLVDDSGWLTLAQTGKDWYHELARAKVLEGPDAWGPIALVGGRLIIRDTHHMICLDVSETNIR